jgi:hypothetical protein
VPQRRDQHAARQPQLDARARAKARLAAVRRRPGEDPAAPPRRHFGLRFARRPARAARPRGALPGARDLDADPRGPPGPAGAAAGGARFLRLPLVPRRAVGRPGGGGVQRRSRDRRHARPQWAAPRALDRDEGRLGGARLGDRCARRARRTGRGQGAPASRQAVPRRSRARSGGARRGDQARARPSPAVRPVAARAGGAHRGSAREEPARPARGAAARQAARVRLDGGGPERPARPDGSGRRGAHRLNGQRRRPGRAVRSAPAALLLLQAALRPGHEPGHRPTPRVDRHESGRPTTATSS